VTLADSGSSYDVVTLVLASVGLGLALASLGWQAATFVLSGSRVRVELLLGAADPATLRTGRGMLVTYPLDKWTPDTVALHVGQGMTEPLLFVEARNVGRMPATVEKITAYLTNGVGLEPTMHAHAPLPFRLEPGSSEKWWVSAAMVRAAVPASQPDRMRVHIAVRLGTGKIVRTGSMTVSR
jgi:hypothetical protein